MNTKNKVFFVAIILLVSVFLSGCADSSEEKEKTGTNQVTENIAQALEKEESLDKDTVQRITPEEVETNETTPVGEVTPTNDTDATEKKSVQPVVQGTK